MEIEKTFETNEIYCEDCEGLCKPTWCDAGIGTYEYWGHKGYDRRPYVGSSCCEGDMFFYDEDGKRVTSIDFPDSFEPSNPFA